MESGFNVKKNYGELIKSGRDNNSTSPYPNFTNTLKGIPHFLPQDSKVTMEHKGSFHKGYIHLSPELGFQIAVSGNTLSHEIDFIVQIPDFLKLNYTPL